MRLAPQREGTHRRGQPPHHPCQDPPPRRRRRLPARSLSLSLRSPRPRGPRVSGRTKRRAAGKRGPGATAPHFLVPAAAARRQRRGPGRETDISFEPAVEPVTNHWPEPGTNLQCGPGWLPPQIGCLVGQKMAAKEPVPARSPASRSRAALPPRRLPATRAGSSPQRNSLPPLPPPPPPPPRPCPPPLYGRRRPRLGGPPGPPFPPLWGEGGPAAGLR